MRSPALAIGWEIWQSHRRGFLAVLAAVPLGAILGRVYAESLRPGTLFHALSFLPLAASLFATFVFFNYTEADRRGRFVGFPSRLFTLPASTWLLVTCPVAFGVAAIVLLYAVWARFIYAPLGAELPLGWPSLYLAAGMICYQTIVWTLAGWRVMRLLALGVCGTLLATGWLVFRQDMAESFAAVLPWGDARLSAQQLLMMALAVVSAGGYVAALVAVARQRHGGGQTSRAWGRLWDKLLDALPGRRTPFSSPAAAQFWFEWERNGFLLPLAVAAVVALMVLPTFVRDELSTGGTMLVLGWLLVTPFLLALAIGHGFGKPDLWSRDTSLPPFLALRPMRCGDWVMLKLKVAALSASLAWLLVLVVTPLWLAHRGDMRPLMSWWETRVHIEGGARAWGSAVLVIPCAVVLTWRLLVAGIFTGLSGRSALVTASVAGMMACSFGGLMTWLWLLNNPAQHSRLTDWLPGLVWLLGSWVVLKLWLGAWGWHRALKRALVTRRNAIVCLGCWLAGVAALVAPLWVMRSIALWIECLWLLTAMALMPLARIPLAALALAENRHRGSAPVAPAAVALPRRFTVALVLVALVGSWMAVAFAKQTQEALPRMVDAGGHRLRMAVLGTGSPTVVFEQFGPMPLEGWAEIQRRTARFTRAVTYDHAGFTGSETGPKPRDAQRVARELHTALRNAGIPPPYLMVGHSFGGPYCRVFAGLFPNEVAGLVLIDPSQEEFFDWLKVRLPKMNRITDQERAEQGEWGCAPESLEQARRSVPPPVPITVMTGAKLPTALHRITMPHWIAAHRDWVVRQPTARHIITTNSGHGIPLEEPELVMETIRNAVQQADRLR